MSVTDDRRIEDLERLACSLTIRVDRLEDHVAGRQPVVSSRRPEIGAAVAAPAAVRHERTPASEPGRSSTPVSLPSAPATGGDSHRRLEDLLGGRILAWLGGLAVLVGVALFLVYAISRGWIGESARVLGGGVGSLALLCLGAWLHEHRGPRTPRAPSSPWGSPDSS